jgi:HK97 family phage major capsid protein
MTALRTGCLHQANPVSTRRPPRFCTRRGRLSSRLAKNAQGDYIAGDVLSPDPARLWGFPVLVTTRMPSGQALVANLKLGAKAYLREAPRLEVAPFGGCTN